MGGIVSQCNDLYDDGKEGGPFRVWMKGCDYPGIAMSRSIGDKIAHNIGVINEPEIMEFTSDELKNHEDYIYFDPDIYVYRDRKHRKDVDLFRVVDLILHKYYEDELIKGRDEYGNLKVDTSKLVKGVYKYQISMDGKRRRWIWYKSKITV